MLKGLKFIDFLCFSLKPKDTVPHDGPVTGCAFSPNKDRIATCSRDKVSLLKPLLNSG